jgi:hypothetical protein
MDIFGGVIPYRKKTKKLVALNKNNDITLSSIINSFTDLKINSRASLSEKNIIPISRSSLSGTSLSKKTNISNSVLKNKTITDITPLNTSQKNLYISIINELNEWAISSNRMKFLLINEDGIVNMNRITNSYLSKTAPAPKNVRHQIHSFINNLLNKSKIKGTVMHISKNNKMTIPKIFHNHQSLYELIKNDWLLIYVV